MEITDFIFCLHYMCVLLWIMSLSGDDWCLSAFLDLETNLLPFKCKKSSCLAVGSGLAVVLLIEDGNDYRETGFKEL